MLRFRDSNALNPIKKLRQAAFVTALLFVGAASPATRTSNDAIVSPVDAEGLQSSDLYALKSVDDVQLSPKGPRIAYTVICNDRPGRPDSRVFVRDLTNVTLISSARQRCRRRIQPAVVPRR